MALTAEQRVIFKAAVATNTFKAIDLLAEIWCKDTLVQEPAEKYKEICDGTDVHIM